MNNPYLFFAALCGVTLIILRSGASMKSKPVRYKIGVATILIITVMQIVYWTAYAGEGKAYYKFMWNASEGIDPIISVIRHAVFVGTIILQLKVVQKANERWRDINFESKRGLSATLFFGTPLYIAGAGLSLLVVAGLADYVFKLDWITETMIFTYLKIVGGVTALGAIYGLYLMIENNIKEVESVGWGVAASLLLLAFYGSIIFSVFTIILSIVEAIAAVLVTILGGSICVSVIKNAWRAQ